MTKTSKRKTSNEENDEDNSVSRGAISFHCDYCQVDIEDHRITCAICEEFDLCIYCFTHGVEIGQHKKDHDYRIVKKHTFPIFDPDWGADEELLLLEGLEMYGMGSWASVADYVGSKTKEECEAHYAKIYMESSTRPLPDITKKFSAEEDASAKRVYHKPESDKYKVLVSHPTNHDIQGYMPGRLEFETEFDNEGECAVKDLCFREDDSPEEIEFKLALLDAYNNKLNKREYRKKFIIQRGLTDYKKNQALDKKRTKEEKLLRSNLKVFARLQTTEDHEELITGILKEEELKLEIAKLQEYVSQGITTYEEAALYDKWKEQKDSRSQLLKDRSNFSLNDIDDDASRNKNSSDDSNSGNSSDNDHEKDNQDKALSHLFHQEVQLCSELDIYPSTYMMIKRELMKEYAIRGSLNLDHALEVVDLTASKMSRIINFFTTMNWIQV